VKCPRICLIFQAWVTVSCNFWELDIKEINSLVQAVVCLTCVWDLVWVWAGVSANLIGVYCGFPPSFHMFAEIVPWNMSCCFHISPFQFTVCGHNCPLLQLSTYQVLHHKGALEATLLHHGTLSIVNQETNEHCSHSGVRLQVTLPKSWPYLSLGVTSFVQASSNCLLLRAGSFMPHPSRILNSCCITWYRFSSQFYFSIGLNIVTSAHKLWISLVYYKIFFTEFSLCVV